MEAIKSTVNYSWCTSIALGKGGTAIVYQGVHEGTGELVAVKTFTCKNGFPSLEAQMREFEVMRELSHKNIVKMLAVEEELQSQNKVIIMELCNKGSLYFYLEDPQNSYGLKEEEFLCFLKDISAGMKYLRDKEISHRDLKPGNIMLHVMDDGCIVYKITDFGAAKHVPDDEEFHSVHGTLGYLHPDMYERAVSRCSKSFRATVDLWSIGVTFYHAATGSLPFRPFHGITDYCTMQDITTKKASCDISGVQYEENGPIIWSKELPDTCLLSPGLRNLITVLLAGILECDDKKMWNFDQFFEYTSDIISRKVFHLYYMNELKEFRLYMQPNKMLEDLKDQIFAQSKVPIPNHLLLFDKTLFISQINPMLNVSTFPSTTVEQPLILINIEDTGAHLKFDFPTLPPVGITKNITNMAKKCCSIAHVAKRLVMKIVRCQKFILRIPDILMSLTEDIIKKLCSDSDVVEMMMGVANHRIDMLDKSYSLLLKYVWASPNAEVYEKELLNLHDVISKQKDAKDQMTGNVTSLLSSVRLFNEKLVSIKVNMEKFKEALFECFNFIGCVERTDTFVRRIHDSWQVFLREGSRGHVVNHKFHTLEKIKLEQNSKKLIQLKEECLQSCLQASGKLIECFRGLWIGYVESCHFGEDLASTKDLLKKYWASIMEVELSLYRLSDSFKPLLKNKNGIPTQSQLLKQVNKDWSEIIEGQNPLIKALEELTLLCQYDEENNNKKESLSVSG